MDDWCDLLCLDLPRAERVRGALPAADALDEGARAAQGLADPSRLRIALALRAAGELCGCDVSWIVAQSQRLVSHHLRTLRASGLAASRRDGRLVLYRLTPAGERLLDALAPAAGAPAPAPEGLAR